MTAYVGFDLETTGVDSFLDVPVSYGFVEHRDGETLREGGYVNPGVPIPMGATAIHGITDEMVRDAPALEVMTDVIAERLVATWAHGGVIVGMNVAYDLTMVDALCRRVGATPLEERAPIGPVMDVLILDRHFDRWRKGPRKLGDLCRHYDVPPGDAHSAVADAEASLGVFEAMTTRYPELLALETSAINDTLRGWYVEWLTSFSEYLQRKGEAPVAAGRYAWPVHADA